MKKIRGWKELSLNEENVEHLIDKDFKGWECLIKFEGSKN